MSVIAGRGGAARAERSADGCRGGRAVRAGHRRDRGPARGAAAGGTMTLLGGALIGSGRPALAVAVPVAAAVIAGDHLAYLSGTAVIGWWRRRRPRRATDRHAVRQGRAAGWLTAAMPSLAGAAQMPYRSFAPRLLAMRLAWLGGLLAAGALAAHSLAAIGRVAGIAGLAVSAAAAA